MPSDDAERLLQVKQLGTLQREILLWLARWDKDEVRTPETLGAVLGSAARPEALSRIFKMVDELREADIDGDAELLAYSKDPAAWIQQKERTEKRSRARRKGAPWLSTELLGRAPTDNERRAISRALKKLDEKYGFVSRRPGEGGYTARVRLTLSGRKAAQLLMLEPTYDGDMWRDLKEMLQDDR